jgi:hypothetical protein
LFLLKGLLTGKKLPGKPGGDFRVDPHGFKVESYSPGR